jgi:hypothetical protein
MTAEVVILNKSAAVLAADSAVTIQTRFARKTYNSASKIAAISREPPIGAIVYGSADLLGVPWESIKRMYRDHLLENPPTVNLESVEKVVEGFFSWLDDQGKWLFQGASTERATRAVDDALDELRTASEHPGDNTSPEQAVSYLISRRLNSVPLNGDIRGKRASVLDERKKLFDERIGSHALRFNGLSAQAWTRVGEFLADAVCNDALNADGQQAGIAFAGFGSKQFHPELVVYGVHGILNNKVECSRRMVTRGITGQGPAYIELLGQTSTIDAFLDGVHPSYQRRLNEIMVRLGPDLSKVAQEALQRKGVDASPYKEALEEAMTSALEGTLGRLLNDSRNYGLPILEMIADLPVPELVGAADSLVSLAAMQQRVGPNPETVGLPVDIAVASKSDGFIWVRRKRYFQPELNRRLDEDK